MAVYNLVQGTTPASYIYSGTATGSGAVLDDTYVLSMTKTGTSSFLFGTYTIDSLGTGNDTLVFRATDVFSGSTSLFFPQFELSATNTPVWTAYDQRSNPLRVEWSSFNQGDTGKVEVWQTPTGSTVPVLAAVIDNAGTYITTDGVAASAGTRTGAMYVRETITEFPGYAGLISDSDRKNLGQFYVNDDLMLSSTAMTAVYDGTSVGSLASGGFDKFIFNTISGQSNLFGVPNQALQALEADIKVDAGALDSGRKYLNLAGSVGASTPGNVQTNFTSVIYSHGRRGYSFADF